MRRHSSSLTIFALAGAAAAAFAACTLSPNGTNPNATSSTGPAGSGGAGTGGDVSPGGAGGTGGAGSTGTAGGGTGGAAPVEPCDQGWAHRIAGSSTSLLATDIAIDANGGVVMTTSFTGAPEPELGVEHEGGNDVLVVKHSAAGARIWARAFSAEGGGADLVQAVAVDGGGDVYITGQVSPGTSFGGAAPQGDEPHGYIAALAGGDGAYRWDLQVPSSFGYDIAVHEGNVFAGGHTTKDTTIPARGGGISLDNQGQTDAFLVKAAADGSGVSWARIYGDGKPQRIYGVAARGGDVFIAGDFEGTIDFGAPEHTMTAQSGSDGFVARLQIDTGNPERSTRLYGASHQSVRALAVDDAENVYIAGHFKEDITIGNEYLDATGGAEDIFLAKLEADLSPDLPDGYWAKRFGDDQPQYATEVEVDAAGRVYLAGYFKGTLDFGNEVVLTADAAWRGFVAVFDPDGTARFARAFAAEGQDHDLKVTAVAPDACGNLVLGGNYDDTFLLDGVTLPSNSALNSSFLARIIPNPPLP